MPKGIDLTNQTFGAWKVIERVPRQQGEKGGIKWKCLCQKCNTTHIVPGNTLRNGTSKQCKNCSNKDKVIDMTGQIVNNIEIIERVRNNGNEATWRCICPSCKRDDWIVKGSSLRKKGVTKCLKCSSLENLLSIKIPYYKDLTNKRFGKLVALYPTEERMKTSIVWAVQCDCGRLAYKSSQYLINGDTTSCGLCSHISKGEEKIIKILTENNIIFEKEKIEYINNSRYRFDFYIPQYNYYIEYDGKQHFENNQWEEVEDIQKRDRIKNIWCIENNIPLIRIPYTRYNSLCLNDLCLETSNFIYKEGNNDAN